MRFPAGEKRPFCRGESTPFLCRSPEESVQAPRKNTAQASEIGAPKKRRITTCCNPERSCISTLRQGVVTPSPDFQFGVSKSTFRNYLGGAGSRRCVAKHSNLAQVEARSFIAIRMPSYSAPKGGEETYAINFVRFYPAIVFLSRVGATTSITCWRESRTRTASSPIGTTTAAHLA